MHVGGGIAVVCATFAIGLATRARRALARSEERRALLASIADTTPTAVVLFGESGRILFTNTAARDLLFDGAAVEGQNFLTMLARAPEPLRRGLLADGDELFSFDNDGERDTFQLSKSQLQVSGQPCTLVTVRPVGAALAREENATLKKVIRIIGHEIGNSLGPIASLIASARVLATRPDGGAKLAGVFDTVEERTKHLHAFLEGYAKLARLPAPRPAETSWRTVLEAVRALWPDVRIGAVPERAGYFDAAQIQQVAINLVKNAREAGGASTDVEMTIDDPVDGGSVLAVLDRGAGMSAEVMQSALLPFFTTKPQGGGLGLALCREIVDLHQGRLRFARRDGGGMVVSVWLPHRERPPASALAGSRVRLGLTRA